ncbi:toxin glutamine deamidase domain-containing protein [Streptomyces jeddahensis]|nr:toxin glutamine deamidase domain-containing protein [Streptomyces jeddahensis]
MMLPDELEWVLEMLGYNWPTADEDKLRESAALWRKFGDDVTELHAAANTSARTVTAHNAGESIDAFTKTYAKFDGGNGSDGYLANAAQAAYIIATVMESCAYLVEFAKWAVIAQLIALAIEIIAAQAAAPFTFGLSEVAALGATQATRLIVRRLLDELKQALMEAIVEAMKEPAVSAIEAIITDLVRQSVNVGFGAQQGYDLGQTVKAGAVGGWEAIKQTPQTLAEGVRDSLGSKAGNRFHHAIDSRIDGYHTPSEKPGSDSGTGKGDGDGSSDSVSKSSSGSSSSSSNGSGSSGPDSSPSTRTSTGLGTNIGGGISADTGGTGIGTPDVGAGPGSDSDSGSGSGSGSGQSPSSSDSPYSRPTPSLSGPSLSDFDDPTSGGPSSSGPDTSSSSGTPGTSGPTGNSGGPSVSGLSSPSPQSAPTPASSGGTSSSPGGGAIGTSIDSLAASVPTQSNAAPTPTTTDPSPAGTGGRTDGGSTVPTSPMASSTAGGGPGTHHGASASGGTPSATGPTSPNPNSGAARNPSASTPGTSGIPSPTGTGPASTPNPTSPTTPRSTPTPTPDGRVPGTADGRTPGTPDGRSTGTPDGRIPTQRTPGGTTPGDGTTPRNTPGSTTPGDGTTPRNTPGTTPGDRTPPRSTTDSIGGTRTHTPGQNPSTTTPNQNPAQSTPPRTASPSTSTPNSPTQPGPTAQGAPGTPGTHNQPGTGTGSTPTRPPHQHAGSAPNTPNAPQQPPAQPHKPENTPPNPQHQQQPQVTAVPIHTVVTTPSSSGSPSHAGHATPQPPGSSQADPGAAKDQQPQQDSLDDIRADLDHYPGGLSEPDPADQQALVDAIPHDEDGTPERFPDPFGPWTQLQNDGGNTVPGRSNNCADCSRSFLETWYGNPQVSAPRTLDLDENGKHNPFTPEDNANDNQIRWTGAAHTYAGPGNDPDTADNIASVLQQAGHGSAAIVQVDWPGGGGHAFNVVNHNGDIIWIDTQSGEVSNEPLHIDKATHVWHIPLDADRNPIDTTQADAEDSESQNNGSQQPTAATESPARPASPGSTQDTTDDQANKPYTDPHDRGDSDTSDESRRVTEDGPDSDTSRTHADPEDRYSREYGIEPDQLQSDLREDRDVHRVELDRVHDGLQRWAESGELTRVLQATSGDGPHPNPDGPRSFTRAQLSQHLDRFDRLSRGEQQAVVASLARLSRSFHQQHSVGVNPERVSRPYRGENEGDPAPKTPDRGAKMSKESLGVRLHRMAVNQLFKKAAFKKLPSDEAGKVRRNGPDFSGKNFAVLEVQGPPPDHEVTYVVDSSVPANQKLPGVQPRHSERHLLDWLKRVDPEGTKYTPLGLYTEREPCGQGEGHMKCATVLLDDRFEDVPIHYSTTYRDDPEGVAIRQKMLAERDETLEKLKDIPDDKIKEYMTEQWSERYKDDEQRLAKALNRLEGKAGTELIDSITKELNAQRKETRTLKEQAITAEFDRHIDALRNTWDTILPELKKK